MTQKVKNYLLLFHKRSVMFASYRAIYDIQSVAWIVPFKILSQYQWNIKALLILCIIKVLSLFHSWNIQKTQVKLKFTVGVKSSLFNNCWIKWNCILKAFMSLHLAQGYTSLIKITEICPRWTVGIWKEMKSVAVPHITVIMTINQSYIAEFRKLKLSITSTATDL